MHTTLAPNRAALPPPYVPNAPSHTLHDGDRVVGWTHGHVIGFTGFASEAEAAGAAWVAHRAIARRLAMDHGHRPIPVDMEPLALARSGEHDLILAGSEAIARLLRPQDDDTPAPAFSIEIELEPGVTELRVHSLSHLAYRALRRSGVRWALWDRARMTAAADRPHPARAEPPAPPAPAAPAEPRTPPAPPAPPSPPPTDGLPPAARHGAPDDESPETMNIIWRALVVSAVAILGFILALGLWASGVAPSAPILFAGACTVASGMAFVNWRRRVRRELATVPGGA